MLLQDFYKINGIQEEKDGNYRVNIQLNKNHKVFEGHFPNNPVTPGVCMIQIQKELTENILAKKLQMTTAKNIKFMEIINPYKNSDLTIELKIEHLSNDEIRVKSATLMTATTALKMDINYQLKN